MNLTPQRYGAIPVPITAAWSVEQEQRNPRVVLWRCGPHGLLKFTSDGPNLPGQGRPLFKIIHGDRARAVIAGDLCQICCERLGTERICTTTGATLEGMPLVSDGLPMHPACALVAYRACIGLQRAEAAGTLRLYVIPPGGYRLAPKILGLASGPGSDERVNRLVRQHGQIFNGPDLQLWSFRRISVAELEQMAAPADAA